MFVILFLICLDVLVQFSGLFAFVWLFIVRLVGLMYWCFSMFVCLWFALYLCGDICVLVSC